MLNYTFHYAQIMPAIMLHYAGVTSPTHAGRGRVGTSDSPSSPDVIPPTPMQDIGRTAGRKSRPASPAESLMEDQLSGDTITVRCISMSKTVRLPNGSAVSIPLAGTVLRTKSCSPFEQSHAVPLDKVMQSLWTKSCSPFGQCHAVPLNKVMQSLWTKSCSPFGQCHAVPLNKVMQSLWTKSCSPFGQSHAVPLDNVMQSL